MTVSDGTESRILRIAALSAGVSDPSSSRLLADRILQKTGNLLEGLGFSVESGVVELAPLASDLARATTTGYPSEALQTSMTRVAEADAVVAVAPVYKAGPSGLFKSFIDVLDDDTLVATPVLLAATAGSSRHSLVIDQQMRPLFAYLRALTTPTSVFAASEDWGTSELGARIDRAAAELAHIVASGVADAITGHSWSAYRHDDSRTTIAKTLQNDDIDFDSPLMRLATGR
jgi:FMN reductase